VIVASVGPALLCYLVVGVCGYWEFGNNVTTDILRSYPMTSVVVWCGEILMLLSVIFSFPLQCHPFRRSITVIFFKSCDRTREKEVLRYETLAFLVSTTAIAMMVKDLGIVFELVGTVGSNTICYIMPPLLYIHHFKSDGWTLVRTLALGLLMIGIVIIPTCLYAVIVSRT